MDEAEVVANLAVHTVQAVFHVLLDGDAALLRPALNAPLLDVFFGDRAEVLPGLAVFLDDGGGSHGVEQALLRRDGAPHIRGQAELLADLHGGFRVGNRLEVRLDDLIGDDQDVTVVVAFPDVAAVVALPVGGDGQHDVGVLVGRGEEVALADDELDGAVRLDALLGALGVGDAGAGAVPDHLDVRGNVLDLLGQVIVADDALPAIRADAVEGRPQGGRVERLAEDGVPLLGLGDGGGLAGGRSRGSAGGTGGTGLDQARAEVVGVVPGGRADGVAGLADVAAHGAQSDRQLRLLLGVVVTGGSPGREQGNLVVLAQDAGDLTQGVSRRAADGLGPFRGLRGAVVFALHVAEEVLVVLGVGRHMLSVEAHAAAVEEVPVDQAAVLILLEHDVRHSEHGGHIGARADRNPLRVKDVRGVGVDRVEQDELGAVLLPGLRVVGRVAQRGPGRVVAEGHDVLAVEHVQTVVVAVVVVAAVAPAEHGGREPAAPGAGLPSGQVVDAQLAQHVGAGAGAEDGVVAVGLVDALDLISDVLSGLVPGDALPLVLTAQVAVRLARLPVLALHRVLEAVKTAGLILLAPAAQAGALLTVHVVVGIEVVGALAQDHAVLDVRAHQALAAAVVRAGSGHPLAAFQYGFSGGGFSERIGRSDAAASGERHGGGAKRSGALQEISAADVGRQHLLNQCHCVRSSLSDELVRCITLPYILYTKKTGYTIHNCLHPV